MTCRHIDTSKIVEAITMDNLAEMYERNAEEDLIQVTDISDRTEFTIAQVKALAEYCGFKVIDEHNDGIDLKNELTILLDDDTNKPKVVYFSEYPEEGAITL